MSSNVVNQVAYLRTSREFPEEIHQLVVEINKTYLDIANAVNNRTISIFPTNRPAITGESWFIKSARQQSLRQIYVFTTTNPINHGIDVNQVDRFTSCYGKYTDSATPPTNWYGIINGTSQAIAGQLVFYVTPTQIVFVTGGGTMPALVKGNIVLEWLSQV